MQKAIQLSTSTALSILPGTANKLVMHEKQNKSIALGRRSADANRTMPNAVQQTTKDNEKHENNTRHPTYHLSGTVTLNNDMWTGIFVTPRYKTHYNGGKHCINTVKNVINVTVIIP